VASSEQQMAETVIFEEEAPPAVTGMPKTQALVPSVKLGFLFKPLTTIYYDNIMQFRKLIILLHIVK
jgi:hypothetical protein